MNFKNKSVYIFALATLIAFSRIYLGVYFTTNIIAAIILGLSCSYMYIFISRKVENSSKVKRRIN